MRSIKIKIPTLPKLPRVNLNALRNNVLDGMIHVCDVAKAKPPTDDQLTKIIDDAKLNDAQKLVVLKFLQRELNA